MHLARSRPKLVLVVSADGRGAVSHAGSRLLADLTDVTGLTSASRTHCVGCGRVAPGTILAGSRSI
ncbi:hypothetical protein GCM10010372_76250 [Streptomyces tauricus]|nr:hypothetical protein GCM10010372_76250 [Streptomyces tauricus]